MFQRARQAQRHTDVVRKTVEPARAPAPVVGKRTLTEDKTFGAPNLYQRAIEAARRELRAVRSVALPAFIRALRDPSLTGVAKQTQLMDGATRVRHLLLTANQHVCALEKAASYRDPIIVHLRHDLDTLARRAINLGAYRGAEDMIPRAHVEEKPRSPSRGADAVRLRKPSAMQQRMQAVAKTAPRAPTAAPRAAVQRKAAGAAYARDVHAVAARGVEGAAAPLPFMAKIQRAFGRHDVSRVRVQIGGAAAKAAQQLGAKAYATGDAIAFASTPDLHTAAHEAAHVVQQRAGVSLDGGIDRAGDQYERHADEVADAVVRGESAEPLLDRMAGERATIHAVQRKQDRAAPTTTPEYVQKHRAAILSATADRILAVGVPEPHATLRWAAHEQAPVAIAAAIREYVDAAPDATLKRLMALSYPADVFAIVDRARRGPGGVQEVAAEVAFAFDAPIAASLGRIGERVAAHRAAHGGRPPKPNDVLASSPLDGVIANVVARGENVVLSAKRAGSVPRRREAREVEYEWIGSRDPSLWNWIHVKSPRDATVEDVARTPLIGGNVIDGSEQAYRIAASPPYFGIPFETAKAVPEAFKHAPRDVKAQLAGSSPGPRIADEVALGRSVFSRTAALAQVPAAKSSDEPAARTLERCHVQIEFLATQLGRWRMAQRLAGARQFVNERRARLDNDPKEAARWRSVLAAQERILHAAASEVAVLVRWFEQQRAKSPDSLIPPALLRVFELYARAAAVSHLSAQAPIALARARQESAMLPIALAEQTIDFAGRGVVDASGSTTEKQDAATYSDLRKRAADIRLSVARGGAASAKDIDNLSVDSDAFAVNVRISTIELQLNQLMKRADAAGYTTAKYEGGLPTIRALPDAIRPKLATWRDGLRKAVEPGQPTEKKRERIASVERVISTFGKTAEIGKWIDYARQRIVDKELRNLIVSLAVQIGIMIVTDQFASAAIAGIRGLALARGLVSEIRAASLLFKAGEVAINAGLNTASQAAVGDGASAQGFAENALAIVLSRAAMKPFAGLLRSSSEVERAVAQSWRQFAKRGLKLAVEIPLESGTGIAASAIAHAVTHHGELSIAGSQEWITQGISIAASRFVHERTQRIHERITEAAKEHGAEKFEKLQSRSDALLRRSQKESPSSDEALAQLAESQALLIAERAAYGDTGRAQQSEKDAALGEDFIDVPLQLNKLSPIVDGHSYEGTGPQIEAAMASVDALGIHPKWVREKQTGVWRGSVGKRVIELHEIQTGPSKAKQLTPRQEAELLEWLQVHEKAPAPPPGFSEKQLEMWKHRQLEIHANYEKVMKGELDPPGLHQLFGGDREKAAAALRLAWEKGVPLTYHVAVGKLDPATRKSFASAEEAFAALKQDLDAAFAKAGISDATVQQIGSGTTGWRGNPGEPDKPKPIDSWTPQKDTDFAVFSAQAQYQMMELAKQRGEMAPVNIPRNGKYTVFKNRPGKGGFYDTPIGRALRDVSIKWNEIIYNTKDPNFENGFDFKLNIPTKPFAKAVRVTKPEPLAKDLNP